MNFEENKKPSTNHGEIIECKRTFTGLEEEMKSESSFNDVDYLLGRRRAFEPKPKIEPRDTKLTLQRKLFISTVMFPDVHGKSDIKCDGKTPEGRRMSTNVLARISNSTGRNSVIKQNFKTPSKPTRCTPACKTTPVCPLTPRPFTNYACVDSKTERMVSGLEGWLKKRGKPMIFGRLNKVSTSYDQAPEASPSDTLYVTCEPIIDDGEEENKASTKINLQPPKKPCEKSLISGALEDLRNLIEMGFPSQDSEEWLSAIRSTYKNITSEPLYWECLALLRNAKPSKGVGCSYAQQVDELEKKFISLEITSPLPSSRRKSRILREINVGNVVPSTSINFTVTGNDKAYVVTPVRRCKRRLAMSSQETRSSYFDISAKIREKAVFKSNPSLDF